MSAALRHAALPYALGLLAMTLALPALWAGWQYDDYLHRAVLARSGPREVMAELFIFMDGDPARARALMDSGELPWWALPTAREAFWRPLAALTHWLDHRLWPHSAPLMHAHSLLWFGALAAAAGALYRRVWPGAAAGLAGLAALLYAVDDAHGFAAGWLANRNGLMAALFGVLCLNAYWRWRQEGWRAGAWLSALWLALGLLSAEAVLGALAYVAAHALCVARGPWRARLTALLPIGGVTAAWLLAYRALGYGAWGTAYADPLREPVAYAVAVAERAPLLLLALWAGPPAELYPFLGASQQWFMWAAAVVLMLALAALLWPLARHSRLARFWALGMLLSLLPISAALPANRLLFFTGLGAMGLIAQLLAAYVPRLANMAQSHATERHPAAGVIARGLIGIHLVLAPLMLPLTAYSPALYGRLEPAAASLPRDVEKAVLVNAPSAFSATLLPAMRAALGLPVPARVRMLGAGAAALDIHRPDAHTLEVRPAGGYIAGFDSVFRGRQHPLTLGEAVQIDGLTITVLALTPDRRPAAVSFRFDRPLEAAGLTWFEWRAGVFVPFAVPAVGQGAHLPALNLLEAAAAAAP